MVSAILYTRKDCHLCDDALAMLREHGIVPEIVDIDADSDLREAFNACVPVVKLDGKIRFRGRVNRILLRRILAGDA